LVGQEKRDGRKMPKIGPSAIIMFDECFYHYYLVNIKRLSQFKQSVHTVFGNAAHEAIQHSFKAKSTAEAKQIFFDYFNKNVHGVGDEDRIPELITDANNIFDNINKIGEDINLQEISDVVCEEEIKEKINDDWLFSGRLDLVFNYKKKWRIIDIKTAKATWTFDKLQNIAVISQPLLYKHFWAKKHNVDPAKIVTYYMFLNKKSKNAVDIKKVPSGPESINKALLNLENTMKLIEKGRFYKNYSGCRWCEFRVTEHCPLDVLQIVD
jgi:hypothetical protein